MQWRQRIAIFRQMHCTHGHMPRQPVLRRHPIRILPFRKFGDGTQSGMHRLHQRFRRNAGGQRINRLNNWQRVKICLRQHVVGMRHLQLVAKPVNTAGNHAFFTYWQCALQPVPLGMEENKAQKSGVVLTGHTIGQGAARRWHVFDNLDLESGNAPAFNFGKGRAVTPVDQSGRQMPQQINKFAACKLFQRYSQLRPDAGQSGRVRKKGR